MVRALLVAAILAPICACAPVQSAPCTKTGADSGGAPLCPLSAAQVAALPESQLFYPGSTLIVTNAEGGALSVNGEPTSADVHTALNTSATWYQLMDWYDRTLVATGWFKKTLSPYQYVRRPPDSTYCELFGIDLYQGPVPGSSDPTRPSGGTNYEVTLAVPSTPWYATGSPDASGNYHAARMPCGGA